MRLGAAPTFALTTPGFQDADGFAYAGTADLQACGEFMFRWQGIADRERAAHDLVFDCADHLFMERTRVTGRHCGTGVAFSTIVIPCQSGDDVACIGYFGRTFMKMKYSRS